MIFLPVLAECFFDRLFEFRKFQAISFENCQDRG